MPSALNSIHIDAKRYQARLDSPANFFGSFSRAPSRCKFWARPPAREVLWGNENHWLGRLGMAGSFANLAALVTSRVP